MSNPPGNATPRHELRRQIMDSRVPKNEREWWASREIHDLENMLLESWATIETQKRGMENAMRMVREALGVTDGFEVLDAIAAMKERIKRLEEVGDEMNSCLPVFDRRWAKAKEAKP